MRRKATVSSTGPVRTCVGCRLRAPAASLVRVVRDAGASLAVGAGLPGRGAWLCPRSTCLESAIRRRAFGRALKAEIHPEELDRLRTLLIERGRISTRMSGLPEKGKDN